MWISKIVIICINGLTCEKLLYCVLNRSEVISDIAINCLNKDFIQYDEYRKRPKYNSEYFVEGVFIPCTSC